MSQVAFNFTGKNFVVTGASSGMGKQITLELAQAGAQILGLARGEKKLKELQEQHPHNIFITPCDVTSSSSLERAIAHFVASHGKLSGSVHCAGITGLTPLKSSDTFLAQEIMNTSFWAGIDLVRLTTKIKYAEHGTSNILFSSVAAHLGEKGMSVYSAAKAALHVAAKSLAKEIASKQHRINVMVPGWVHTEMTSDVSAHFGAGAAIARHLLGTGFPDDVSGLALFLLSDRARWITGANFTVDGGCTA